VTAVLTRPAEHSAPARRIPWERLWWLPLPVILAAQAVLSARIMLSFSQAGPDEARYIWAGHQLFYELWHGGGSPYFETYFSGAPVVYSPVAAVADHFGGIAAVRLANLCFMLGATLLLFIVTRRLFGYVAALAAMTLFAGLGLAHDIGVYGNYDSLALLLMACAVYCAVRSSENRWLLLVPLALLAANAAKYMTLLFDPVIIGMAALQAAGWRNAMRRAIALAASTVALLGVVAALGGGAYVQGILYTTVNRHSRDVAFTGRFPTSHIILHESWAWIGIILALALLAVVLALIQRVPAQRVALLGLLFLAGVLVTLEALHLHSDESMHQHDTFSAWLAAIPAGYAVAAAISYLKFSRVLAAVAVLACLAAAVPYWSANIVIAQNNYEGCGGCHPGAVVISPGYARMVLPYLHAGRLLVGFESFALTYDSGLNVPWFRLFDDIYLKYPIPGRGGDSHGQRRGPVCFRIQPHCMYLEGPAAYRAAIRAHWFSFVSLYKGHIDASVDRVITQTVEHTPGYVVLTRSGEAPTWIYATAYPRSLR